MILFYKWAHDSLLWGVKTFRQRFVYGLKSLETSTWEVPRPRIFAVLLGRDDSSWSRGSDLLIIKRLDLAVIG